MEDRAIAVTLTSSAELLGPPALHIAEHVPAQVRATKPRVPNRSPHEVVDVRNHDQPIGGEKGERNIVAASRARIHKES